MNTHDKIVKCRSCDYVGPCDPTCCERPDYDGATAEEAWQAAIEADRKRRGEHQGPFGYIQPLPYGGADSDDYVTGWNDCCFRIAQEGKRRGEPVAWIRVAGDRVIASRCKWIYPQSTDDYAGTRDERRYAAIGGRDGDIVVFNTNLAETDLDDLRTMLAWQVSPQPAAGFRAVGEIRVDANRHPYACLLTGYDEHGDQWKEGTPIYAAPQPAEPVKCIGCEGKPAPENNPCAVCGKEADPVKEQP